MILIRRKLILFDYDNYLLQLIVVVEAVTQGIPTIMLVHSAAVSGVRVRADIGECGHFREVFQGLAESVDWIFPIAGTLVIGK